MIAGYPGSAMSYILIKNLHIGLAVLSIGGFMLRFAWKQTRSALFQHKLTRILPHVVDTLFLTAGICLSVFITQYPFHAAWLTAKVLGLLAYIMLGSLALKRAGTRASQYLAFAGALLCFTWIASVARSKNAWGFFAGWL